MDLKAYAKINLILDVNKKLENGYHDISFLMTTLDLYDEINITKAKENEVIVVNNEQLSGKNNLAFKALTLLQEKYSIQNNYKIVIKKNIPIAAGMAGGSTDAATVINAINKIEQLNLKDEQLIEVALNIGADVPFCIFSKLAIVSGVGEKIKLVKTSIPNSNVLMINTGEELSTKEVYQNHEIKEIKENEIENIISQKEYKIFYGQLRNSLQETAFKLMPQIKSLYEEIIKENDITKVLISGSGPTLLVFDNDIHKLNSVKKKYKNKYKYVEIYKINNNEK